MRGEIGEDFDAECDELDAKQYKVNSLLECFDFFGAFHLEISLALAAPETHFDLTSLIK